MTSCLGHTEFEKPGGHQWMSEFEAVTELIDMDNRTQEGFWKKSQKTSIFKKGLPRER